MEQNRYPISAVRSTANETCSCVSLRTSPPDNAEIATSVREVVSELVAQASCSISAPVREAIFALAAGRVVITVPEAGSLFGLSKSASYRAAASGDLPTIRMAGKLMCPVALLARLVISDNVQ